MLIVMTNIETQQVCISICLMIQSLGLFFFLRKSGKRRKKEDAHEIANFSKIIFLSYTIASLLSIISQIDFFIRFYIQKGGFMTQCH